MKLYTWFLVGLLAIVAIIGIPGNILVLVVYANKTKRTGTRVFILGLAGVDLFICALSGYRFYLWIHEESFSSDLVCRFFSWIGLASELSSAFVTTAVAVDRYLAICRPHLGWMTHKRAQSVCVAGIVASAILTLPTLAVYMVTVDLSGKQSCGTAISAEYRTWVYIALSVMAVAFAAMMITALAMYMLIYREVRKRRKVRPAVIKVVSAEKSCEKDGPSSNLAAMLILGESMIGITVTRGSQGLGARRHSVGEAEGISRNFLTIRSRKTMGSPVSFRRTLKERVSATTNSEAQEGRTDLSERKKVHLTALGSSSDDAGSDGPKTKLNPDQSEPSDQAIQKAKKSKTGKMLLLATVVFVVTWSARLIMWLISYMLSNNWTYLRDHDEVAFAFLSLLQHLYYTTPAVNPAIYSFVNNKFREECVRVLRKINCLRGTDM